MRWNLGARIALFACLSFEPVGVAAEPALPSIASEFRAIGQDIVEDWVRHPEWTPEGVRVDQFARALRETRISVLPKVYLAVDGGEPREVEAKNYGYSIPLRIELNESRWKRLTGPPSLKKGLVAHEVLGLLGHDIGSYQSSRKYLAALRADETRAEIAAVKRRSGAQMLAVGETHTCVSFGPGIVLCWGSNIDGQRGSSSGLEDPRSASAPHAWPHLGVIVGDFRRAPPVQLVSGLRHNCVLLANGRVSCWGYLAKPEDDSRRNWPGVHDYPVLVHGNPYDASNHAFDPARLIAAGDQATCLITYGGALSCWGYDFIHPPIGSNGALAFLESPTEIFRYSPADAAQIRQLSLGYQHACLLWSNGSVGCFGRLRIDRPGERKLEAAGCPDARCPRPVAVPDLDNAIQVESGANFSCALTTRGQVKCWGYADHGALGSGGSVHCFDEYRDPSPVLLKKGGLFSKSVPLEGVRRISVSMNRACALTVSGHVYCWGGEESSVARLVPGFADRVADVRVGAYHACAVLADGGVQCWGDNTMGQTGLPPSPSVDSPAKVPGL